jgi:hypothetical protein
MGGVMSLRRSEVAGLLRSLGLHEEAEKLQDELPESVEEDELIEFGARYGITREWLMGRMGGSP